MRLVLLALLPAALAACGSEMSSDRETMPAPEPTMEEAAAAAAEASGTSSSADIQAMEGEWSTSTDRGDASISFSSGDEMLFNVICRSAEGEGAVNTVVFQLAVEEGDTIDLLTSAGNVSIPAVALDEGSPMIGGALDANINAVGTIANANGPIRVQAGGEEIVIPADQAMKDLINECRPETVVEEEPAEGEEAEGEEAETETE